MLQSLGLQRVRIDLATKQQNNKIGYKIRGKNGSQTVMGPPEMFGCFPLDGREPAWSSTHQHLIMNSFKTYCKAERILHEHLYNYHSVCVLLKTFYYTCLITCLSNHPSLCNPSIHFVFFFVFQNKSQISEHYSLNISTWISLTGIYCLNHLM